MKKEAFYQHIIYLRIIITPHYRLQSEHCHANQSDKGFVY